MHKLILFVLLFSIFSWPSFSQTKRTSEWLKNNVRQLKSIDPTDDDFKDLEFLVPLFEGKDIIMLGEEAHSFAHTFAAKTRFIKFLHQRLGYNVLAFEIDGFSLHEANQKSKKTTDKFSPIQKRMYPFWGQATTTQELFEYLENNKSLKVTGFDVQPSGSDLILALESILKRNNSEILRYQNYNRFVATFNSFYRQPIDSLRMPEYALMNVFIDDMLYEGKLRNSPLKEEKIVYKALENFRNDLRNRIVGEATTYHMMGDLNPKDSLYGFLGDKRSLGAINRRDEQMAINIQWLKEELYPDEKIIIWAASAHTMYNRHQLKTDYTSDFPFHSRFMYGYNYLNMGTHLKRTFHKRIYSVGFSPVSGTIDHATSKTYNSFMDIKPVPNSIEEQLLHIKGTNLYLNFTQGKNPNEIPDSLFNKNTISNILGGTGSYGDISTFFDGVLFMKEVTPIKYVDE